jgi:hypothetical protein
VRELQLQFNIEQAKQKIAEEERKRAEEERKKAELKYKTMQLLQGRRFDSESLTQVETGEKT